MFAFDEWAEWLKSESDKVQGSGPACHYSDNRDLPEAASNPSFGIERETLKCLGSLRFWKCGTCDYLVFEKATGNEIANEAGLDANNQTVAALFARFNSLFDDGDA
ncbi:MAG TPA: hypothetical protein VM760_03860 [Sphingomicrobium sp.]|nr:hypothetical protein [Sphingomicrobium sp.]